MGNLGFLLVIFHFFAGSLGSVETQLFDVFNIFQKSNSPQTLAQNLNMLLGPIRNPVYEDLQLGSRSAIILDYDSGKVLYQKNASDRLPMASTTKIIGALVVLDHFGGNLNKVITVSGTAANEPGSQINLVQGERMTVHNLMKGMLIQSGNDAAIALAEAVAGSSSNFITLMNKKAGELGLYDTHFADVAGFDSVDHYSTARDMAKAAQVALGNPTFASIVSVGKTVIRDVSGQQVHSLVNTNQLIGKYDNVIGVKTGTSEGAGESLVAAVMGDSKQKVILVLLNSPDRFREGKLALDWALKAYTWIEVV